MPDKRLRSAAGTALQTARHAVFRSFDRPKLVPVEAKAQARCLGVLREPLRARAFFAPEPDPTIDAAAGLDEGAPTGRSAANRSNT